MSCLMILADKKEFAMKTAEEILKEKNRPIISVDPDVTIHEAIRVMVENKIGAILIKDNGQIVGIFSERDLLNHSIEEGFDPKTALIKDYMARKLCAASSDEPIYKLQDKMLGTFCRHLLIVKDNVYIGLLSAGDITRAGLNEKTRELESVSWEYYENWRWRKKSS